MNICVLQYLLIYMQLCVIDFWAITTASKSIVTELNKDNKLNGDNYEIWAMKVRYVLEEQDASNPLDSIMVEPEEGITTQHRLDRETYVAWNKNHTTARIIILSAMEDDRRWYWYAIQKLWVG